jgi:hypothetical protein
MTTEISIEEDLISRYKAWLLAGIPNPYNNSKWEWIKEVNEKIKELEKIIKQ